MAVLSLQSAFAVIDFCDFAENVSQVKAEPLDIPGQEAAHEDCAECNCQSCPCCSNVTFALVALFPLFDSFEPFISAFEPTRFDSPYYLLLRPPKI
ncbi:hypothetical protein [Thalassomonas actiniarum]|uniref:Uncharacterized protein n=1 Tax=Thalassomonas actiniarum TaxID=485447 RepID=A0AAF0C654_9GAMM|nr:hypothetical protein [Thalassomonas actiniarum]WDE01589.1 hypothetical protein SG35_013785 [Thalassomonas actiniarum]